MANLLELMKQASSEAIEQGKPVNIVFGTVISDNPLQIDIETKVPLTAPFLVLARTVTDYKVSMTMDHETGQPIPEPGVTISQHKHKYNGTKEFTVHNGLQQGEKVVLIRMQGGDKYLVLDRVG